MRKAYYSMTPYDAATDSCMFRFPQVEEEP
jgi:hypothetical protein